jgi:hypothetical protein
MSDKPKGVCLDWDGKPHLTFENGYLFGKAERILYPEYFTSGEDWPVDPVTKEKLNIYPPYKMYEMDEISGLSIAWKRFILALAESLKLDVFVRWLNKKLEKLPEYKIWLLAFTFVVTVISIMYLLDRAIKTIC